MIKPWPSTYITRYEMRGRARKTFWIWWFSSISIWETPPGHFGSGREVLFRWPLSLTFINTHFIVFLTFFHYIYIHTYTNSYTITYFSSSRLVFCLYIPYIYVHTLTIVCLHPCAFPCHFLVLLKPSKAEGKGRTDEREFGLQSREKENQILPHRRAAHRILAAGYGRRMEGERAWGINGDRGRRALKGE